MTKMQTMGLSLVVGMVLGFTLSMLTLYDMRTKAPECTPRPYVVATDEETGCEYLVDKVTREKFLITGTGNGKKCTSN